MTVRDATWCLVLGLALAACSPSTARQAAITPTPVATAVSPVASPSQEPPPSLVCPGKYQTGHPLVVAALFSQAGYSGLDVFDVADPLAPMSVCAVYNAPYPIQPVQWLSPSTFALVAYGQPSLMLWVDVNDRSITIIRHLADNTYVAVFSPDRTWLATMESTADDTRFARLYGPSGARTLATYPPAGGHGGTIYGFGGPTIEFSPDGTLVVAVDYEANYMDATVADLQVFDLQGVQVFSAARGAWAVWVKSALYYSGADPGDPKVYRWVLGSAPAVVMQLNWLEPAASPDGQSLAYLSFPNAPGGTMTFQVLDTRSGASRTLAASGLRIYPLFVTSSLIWVSDLAACDSCYGGSVESGKVFAYDLATGSTREVKLPEPLSRLAPASLSPDA